MKQLDLKEVEKYVEVNIATFHKKRIESIKNLKLSNILRRKNPYLFKAKNMQTADEIVKGFLEAHISSNEEGIFGDWLEGLAIFINTNVFEGWKSGIKGVDLEFNKNNTRYIVNIKSGPNWGNSSQIEKMSIDFNTAKKTLRTSNSDLNIIAVNGCCYGVDNKPDKGTYFKYCGQRFWEFISADSQLYLKIIEPLGHNAKIRNEEFLDAYSRNLNLFTKEFINGYCKADGSIDWEKLVKFNSSALKSD